MPYSISRRPDPWRLTIQALFTALFAAGPFITLGNSHLLRFDFTAGVFHLVGMPLRPEGLLLVLFAVLAATFLLLWLSASLGRLWCGWGCPQSVLSDFADWALRLAGQKARAAAQLAMVAFSGVFAAVTLLYFVYPSEFFSADFFRTPTLANVSFALLWLALYLDMALMKRTFCRFICPYGKFLSIVSDERALTVEMIPALKEKCIECAACVRACPMQLDVRIGAGGDCIRCGRCIDACRRVMARQKSGALPSLIGFNSGGVSAWRMLFGPRRWPLIIATAGALIIFLLVASNPVAATLQVRVNPAMPTKTLEDATVAVFLDVSVANGLDRESEFTLRASGPAEAVFKGLDNSFSVPRAQRERFRVVVVLPPELAKRRVSLGFELFDGRGAKLAATALELPVMATGGINRGTTGGVTGGTIKGITGGITGQTADETATGGSVR
jgi:polyferredoxin